MEKQNKAVEKEKTKNRKPPVETTMQEDASQTGPGFNPISAESCAGDGMVDKQATLLSETPWRTVQKQGIAIQIGETQGNRHLQRVLKTIQRRKDEEQKTPQQSQGQEQATGEISEKSDPREAFEKRLKANEGGGSPLPEGTREFMEAGFGTDMSQVRVHTDDEAAQLSKAVKAEAFTQGDDIYFNENRYDPNSSAGKQLLAHELTHTIQQGGGSASHPQTRMEISTPYEPAELEAESLANAVVSGQVVSVTPVPGPAPIARRREGPTPFGGAAGTADVRAITAGGEAGGFSMIRVSTDYTLQQAARKERQMDAFRHEDIPFVYNNMEHYAYKKMNELRQEYVNDVSRISLAEGAFNSFVLPGSLANKSTAQFKRLQFELGYSDEINPAEELTERERKKLAENLDEKEMNRLNSEVNANENLTRGLRTEILGTSHNMQAAMQARAAVLAREAGEKAGEDKKKIDEKIKAVKDGIEAVGKVIEVVSFAAFGGPAAIGEVAGGGATAVKGGLELGSKGTSLIGATTEFIMTQMYKEQIEKAKQEAEKAKVAQEQAEKLDADLRLTGSMLNVKGQIMQLEGAMEKLFLAHKARKDYFAKLGAETDRETGGRAGGKISQLMAYISQANETKSHIQTAKVAATEGLEVMRTQISQMETHRDYAYVANSAGVWDDRARLRDAAGPDLAQLRAARDGLQGFQTSADSQLVAVNLVISALPAPR